MEKEQKNLLQLEFLMQNQSLAQKKLLFSVACSPLVKTAIAGEDPNWGRVIMGIGKSGEK